MTHYLTNLNFLPSPDLFDKLFAVNNTMEQDRRLALISNEQIKTAVLAIKTQIVTLNRS